jgi:cell division protein ZapA
LEEKLKIKLSIADRVYPLTIRPEQEEGLRKAAKNIDLLAKQYEQNYAVRDKQDVLAMCALQFATSIISDKQEDTGTSNDAIERLEEMAIRISNSLGD